MTTTAASDTNGVAIRTLRVAASRTPASRLGFESQCLLPHPPHMPVHWLSPNLTYSSILSTATVCRMIESALAPRHRTVSVMLRLLLPEQGGPKRALQAGYRADWIWSGQVEPPLRAPFEFADPDRRSLKPGSSAMLRLHPLQPDRWSELHVGAGILLCGIADPMRHRIRYLGLAEVLDSELIADGRGLGGPGPLTPMTRSTLSQPLTVR